MTNTSMLRHKYKPKFLANPDHSQTFNLVNELICKHQSDSQNNQLNKLTPPKKPFKIKALANKITSAYLGC